MSDKEGKSEQNLREPNEEIPSYQDQNCENTQETIYESVGSQYYDFSQETQQSEFRGVLFYTQDEYGNSQEQYYFTQDEEDSRREEQDPQPVPAPDTQTESEAGWSCFGSDPISTPRPVLNWPSQPGDLGTPTNTQTTTEPEHEFEWNSQEGSFKY
jgi:hypothetical protein